MARVESEPPIVLHNSHADECVQGTPVGKGNHDDKYDGQPPEVKRSMRNQSL